MIRVLAITLARGGSKGVPGKNIRILNGKPTLAYIIEEAKKSRRISRHVISTEDEAIKQIAIACAGDDRAVIDRPAAFATDDAPSLWGLQHALVECEKQDKRRYDYVVDLRNSPLTSVADIDGAVDKLVETGADSVIGVAKLDDHHPARIKKIVNDRLEDFCVPETSTRRQDLAPWAYIRNGTIYAMRRDVLVSGVHFGSVDSRPWIMPAERSVNVDDEMDFLLVEAILAHRS